MAVHFLRYDNMRKIITFSVFFFTLTLSIACSEDFQKSDFVLKTENGSIRLYVKYINKEKRIVDSFYGIFEDPADVEKPIRLVALEDGVIRNRFSDIIIDLRDHTPKLYGFSIQCSYPTSKQFTPGFNLDPYWGSSDNIGDNLRIQWNNKTRTFEKNPSVIP